MLQLLVTLFCLIVNICALKDPETYPNILHLRTKRQTSRRYNSYSCLKLSFYSDKCGGDMSKAFKLTSFPQFVNKFGGCYREDMKIPTFYLQMRKRTDWCFNLTTVASWCETEAPKAACLADQLARRGCVQESWWFSYVKKLCTVQGMALACGAMASPCFAEMWYHDKDRINEKFRVCQEYVRDDTLKGSCSMRENYSKCIVDPINEKCGSSFAGLNRLYVQAYLESLNKEAGAVQC